MSSNDVEFLVKVRDAAALLLDACTERLEKLGPTGTSAQSYDLAKIKWEPKTGPKGPYEMTSDTNNPDYKLLLEDLRAHKDKFRKDQFFIWIFEDGKQIGRKRV